MSAFKLIVIALAVAGSPDNGKPPAQPNVSSFDTYDACVEAQAMYRSIPNVKAKCIPDAAVPVVPYPRPVYRGPRPLDRLPYGAVPTGEADGSYVYPLPRQAPPQGPYAWPQDY